MKILLLYPYFNQQQLMQNFISRLSEYGIEADVVCFNNLVVEKNTSVIWPKSVQRYFRIFGHCDSFGRSLKSRLTRMLRHLLDSYYLIRLLRLYDLVDFHAYILSYQFLMKECLKHNLKFDITIWGSDLLRASDKKLEEMRFGLNNCYRLKMLDGLKERLTEYYGHVYDDKCRIVYFGNSEIENIDGITEEDALILKHKLYGDIDDKTIVVCGYNSGPNQNHKQMIEALSLLSDEEKSRIHVVLPMTYLGSEEYRTKIRKQIESQNISFTILDRFLDIKEVAAIRKTADITLNIQTTDALAGSLQGHLYCGNVCIFGDWLRYDVYTNNGIYYIKTTIEDITQHLQDVLRNYPAYKERCIGNHDKIRELFSWEVTIKKQAAVYGE